MIECRHLAAAITALSLAGCAATVDYGKIRHADYVADARCDPAAGAPVDATALPLFVVTTRLPDCRTPIIAMLHHRADHVRYGRFAAPIVQQVGGGKRKLLTPLVFQDKADWWRALQAASEARAGRVLVFVHGYRETFETTSKDAAQIARMSAFKGPVIEYSWPSQGKVLSYAVDETNMYFDVLNFQDFLKTLAESPWVKEIVIVSHSLGARLVVPAIEYVDRTSSNSDSSNISNIILASPDIDSEAFERDIGTEVLAMRRVKQERRITVYVSLADRALAASRALHGYPRLGSPYCFNPFEAATLEAKGLPVRCYPAREKPGVTVIDTTDVPHGTAGHSNYLRSAAVCRDFVDVVKGKRARKERTATKTANVFRLLPDPADPKPDDDQICNRIP